MESKNLIAIIDETLDNKGDCFYIPFLHTLPWQLRMHIFYPQWNLFGYFCTQTFTVLGASYYQRFFYQYLRRMTRLTVGLCRKILSRAICVIIVIIVVIIVVVVIIIFVNWSSSSSNDLVDKVKVTRCYHPEEIGWNCKTHQQEYKYFQKYDGLQKYNEYEHKALYEL